MTHGLRKLTLFISCLVAMALASCSIPDFAPEYAISKLDLSNGQAIYFKREVRGINGNYDVVAISPNGDPCASMNRDTDYSISESESVYYKLEGDALHLYFSTATGSPARPFPVKLVNHEINNMDFDKFKRSYLSRGITRLDLVVDGTKRCG